jgi:uncharacterized protein with gpF-like domain
MNSRTWDYLHERVEDLRAAERQARADDDDCLADIQADLMEAEGELSNALYYDSLED